MFKNIYDIVGERIWEERKKAGLAIERLAELAQISSSFLAYIETKGRKASLGRLMGIALDTARPQVRNHTKTGGSPENPGSQTVLPSDGHRP